mmetsp:Transcript_7460/g.25678  ORF Transcript_7460/g.25678 Transcript_7460/m.25678 type:complete len:251 (-) Transcript_7460:119-871(-)
MRTNPGTQGRGFDGHPVERPAPSRPALALYHLDVGWVEHDAALGSQSLGWEGLPEGGPDGSAAAVGAGDLSPHAPELGGSVWSGLLSVGLVDVGHLLSQVEWSLLLALDALDLEQRSLMVRVALASLVVDNLALHVKSVEKGTTTKHEVVSTRALHNNRTNSSRSVPSLSLSLQLSVRARGRRGVPLRITSSLAQPSPERDEKCRTPHTTVSWPGRGWLLAGSLWSHRNPHQRRGSRVTAPDLPTDASPP